MMKDNYGNMDKLSKFKNINCKFFNGPSSDIPLAPHHGGPIFSMDIKLGMCVTASSDHGARVYNMNNGKQIRELYNKSFGHTEWVTTVKILNDGKILTGGMDSKICVWDSKAVKCIYLTEHEGSISKIMTDFNDPNETIFISSSYDTCIRIYNTAKFQNVCVLKGIHKKPVTEFNFTNSILISGDRDGKTVFWDLNSEKSIITKQLHQGQISNIVFHSDQGDNNLILTSGINDGMLNVFDMRTNEKVFSKVIHKGAINLLKTSPNSNLIFTGSADKTVKVFDILKGFSEISVMKSTDAVYCGDLYESSFLAVGSGDGSLLGYNLNTFDCCWGYGVEEQGGVRCLQIEKNTNKIVTAGDSGKALQVLFD